MLPFVSIGSDEETQWFCDGVAEDAASMLASHGRLRIVCRTSVFFARQPDFDATTAARRVNADHALVGSGRIAGNEVRLTIQLIDTRSDATVWSEIFHRELSDVLAAQEDIAARIAAALNAVLTPPAPS